MSKRTLTLGMFSGSILKIISFFWQVKIKGVYTPLFFFFEVKSWQSLAGEVRIHNFYWGGFTAGCTKCMWWPV